LDIYNILGLDKNASHSTIEEAYQARRNELAADRFLPGAQGLEAAKKIDALDTAYRDYVDSMVATDKSDEQPSFEQVDSKVKEGDLNEAQRLLDNIYIRNGEWHYFQALIFYKREWLSECRKHLAMAVSMDPNNNKYKETLQKLDMQTGSGTINPNGFGAANGQGINNTYTNRNGFVDCCCAMCLADLCCSCMR